MCLNACNICMYIYIYIVHVQYGEQYQRTAPGIAGLWGCGVAGRRLQVAEGL
jgi:hypothetical protein